MAGGQPLHWLYPLQIGTKGQRFYYWQLAVSKWKTDEPLLVRWPSCQHVATRIPGGAERVVACSHWGGSRSPLDLLQPPGAIRSLHVLLKVDGGPIKIENPLILTTVKMVKSGQFLLEPGEEARQREQRQCAGFFGLLLPYLPFDSLFPRHPTNRWLQFLLPAAERTTRESHMRCSTFVCATHLSPAWPWLEHSRKYISHNCQEKIYLVSHQLKVAIVKQINRYPM